MSDNVPRFMTHCAASRPKFNDPGQRREIVPVPSLILKDQFSDPGVPRTLTPKREAMWRNFGGSQAAQVTGHAGMAFAENIKPNVRADTVVDGAAGRRSNTPQPGAANASAARSGSAAMMSSSLALPGDRRGSGASATIDNAALNISASSGQQQPAAAIAVGTKPDHWTVARTTTCVPTDKNSAVLPERADTIVRSAPFPHHKNMVFPSEDPSVDTTRKAGELWMYRPLRNGQFTATRKRTYDLPGYFRTSEELEYRGGSDKASAAAAHAGKKNVGPRGADCLQGAAAIVTEPEPAAKMRFQPLVAREFNPPYNETERVIGGKPQEVPRAAKTFGRAHLQPPQPAVPAPDVLPGWSAQPVERARGRTYDPKTYECSRDMPRSDTPPAQHELPAFRPSIVVMHGAPAFVPSPMKPSNTPGNSRSGSPQQAGAAGGGAAGAAPRGLSPRRMQFTPTDSDIFGAKREPKPWHHPASSVHNSPVRSGSPSRAVGAASVPVAAAPMPVPAVRCLSPAPESRPRCKGAGTYSPMRVMPQYRF